MDGRTFDRLTQLVGGSTRRFALKAALGGATIAGAGLLGSTASTEAAKKKNKRCKKKLKRCRRNCTTCESLLVGEPCTDTSECCGTDTNMACGIAVGGDPLASVCCGAVGASCTDVGDCCLGLVCDGDGECIVPLP